jgi:hypothetical protein
LEKEKRKGIPSQVGRGGFSAQPGAAHARARAPAQLRTKAGRRRRRAGVTASSRGPHVSESGGGDGATGRRRGRTGRPRGKKPDRRWARRRFAAGDPVLGPRGGALAWGGAGEPRGGLNLARGGREGGCPRGGGGAPRRGSPPVGFRRGIGAGKWCSEFAAM